MGSAAEAEPRGTDDAPATLTKRELEIVALVGQGLRNKNIADVLRISEWTVAAHLRRIFVKLGVDTRSAMVLRCACVLGPGRGAPVQR